MYPAELPPHVRPAPDLPRSAPRCHGVFRSGVPRTACRGPLPCRSTRAATAAGSHMRQLRLSGRGEREAPRAVGADVLETVARVRPRQRAERAQPHHESNVGRHASTVALSPGRGLRGARWCRVAVVIVPAAAVAAFSRRRLLRCGGESTGLGKSRPGAILGAEMAVWGPHPARRRRIRSRGLGPAAPGLSTARTSCRLSVRIPGGASTR